MYALRRESLTNWHLKAVNQWGENYEMDFDSDSDLTMYPDRVVIESGLQNAELPCSMAALVLHSCIRAKA